MDGESFDLRHDSRLTLHRGFFQTILWISLFYTFIAQETRIVR